MSAVSEQKQEYRVVWKRVGVSERRKIVARRATADRLVTMLGPEPWKAFGKGPDDPACKCRHGCYDESSYCGKTMREHDAEQRALLPAVEYVRLEVRDVLPWRALEQQYSELPEDSK